MAGVWMLLIKAMPSTWLNLKTLFLIGTNCIAQNYDNATGATQLDKPDLTKEQLARILKAEKKVCIYSTVNSDNTPNAGAFGAYVVDDNYIYIRSLNDAKTTKINLKERHYAVLIVALFEKNEEGFDGAKVILKYINNDDKIEELKAKLEKSSETTTFFEIVKIMPYH